VKRAAFNLKVEETIHMTRSETVKAKCTLWRRLAGRTIVLVITYSLYGHSLLAETLTIEGVTFEDIRWGNTTTDSVTVYHKTGVATIPLEKLPLGLQQRFGYDPKKADERLAFEKAEQQRKAEANAVCQLEEAKVLKDSADAAVKREAFDEAVALFNKATGYLATSVSFFAGQQSEDSRTKLKLCSELRVDIEAGVMNLMEKLKNGSLVEADGHILTKDQYQEHMSQKRQAEKARLKEMQVEVQKRMSELLKKARTGYSERRADGSIFSMNVARNYDQLMAEWGLLDVERVKIQKALAALGDENSKVIVAEHEKRSSPRYVADQAVAALIQQGVVKSCRYVTTGRMMGTIVSVVYEFDYITKSGFRREGQYVFDLQQSQNGEWFIIDDRAAQVPVP